MGIQGVNVFLARWVSKMGNIWRRIAHLLVDRVVLLVCRRHKYIFCGFTGASVLGLPWWLDWAAPVDEFVHFLMKCLGNLFCFLVCYFTTPVVEALSGLQAVEGCWDAAEPTVSLQNRSLQPHMVDARLFPKCADSIETSDVVSSVPLHLNAAKQQLLQQRCRLLSTPGPYSPRAKCSLPGRHTTHVAG